MTTVFLNETSPSHRSGLSGRLFVSSNIHTIPEGRRREMTRANKQVIAIPPINKLNRQKPTPHHLRGRGVICSRRVN